MLFAKLLFKDADFHYSNTAHCIVLKLGTHERCTSWKLFPNFRVAKFKDATVTSHRILKIVPQASHISSHRLILICIEVSTCLHKSLFSWKGEKKFVIFQVKLVTKKLFFFNSTTSFSGLTWSFKNYYSIDFKLQRVVFQKKMFNKHLSNYNFTRC